MRFLAPVLTVLNRIFRFEGGGVTTAEIELRGPVQLVLDVSRPAELGFSLDPRTGGFYGALHTNDHTAGAGSIDKDDINPYSTITGVVIDDSVSWVWLMWAGVGSDTSGCIGAGTSIVVTHTGIGSVFSGSTILIRHYTGSVALATTQSIDEGGICTDSIDPHVLPMLLTAGSLIGFRSTALLAGNIRAKLIYWAGPIGVNPPSFR